MDSKMWLRCLSLLSLLLAFSVILLGAYTRLKDAGLGCPDWPGCYAQWVAPQNITDIQKATLAFPSIPLDIAKAKTEMTHRYFAESLGGLIILLSFFSISSRCRRFLPFWLPVSLVALVLFQGLLGKWTVTLQLWPIIVVLHLLGGFATFALLWLVYLYAKESSLPRYSFPPLLSKLTLLMLTILILQIFLGGWTSANGAALICPDFPKCQGYWWPNANFKNAFDIFSLMDTPSRTAVHLAHRMGALLTLIMGGGLVHYILFLRKQITLLPIQNILRRYARIFTVLLLTQITLGVSNVIFFLPLPLAMAHNGIAALLLLTLVAFYFTLHTLQRENHGK